MPFIDFLEGIIEIEGRVHQKILFYTDLPLFSIENAQISTFKRSQTYSHEVDSCNLDVISISYDRKGFLHGFIQITGVCRSVAWCAASAGRQCKIPAHRGGENDDMRALLI